MEKLSADPRCHGTYTLWDIDEHTGLWLPRYRGRNSLMYNWGLIASQCIALGDTDYALAAMYIEFKNVAVSTDEVDIPTFTRDAGLDYYDNLPADQDFLRVTFSATPTIAIKSGYEDFFTAPFGNRAVITAQTSGATGVLGRTFSDGVNSKVFGIAMVATPTPGDRNDDIIYSRAYFPVLEQKLKVSGFQIGITWNIDWE